MADLRAQIENEIKSGKVVIYSKSKCPYCVKVKQLFDSLNVQFKAIELDQLENGAALQQALSEKTGKRTVPQVFINEKLIGGCDDTMAKNESGELALLLKDN
ncbi:glutaredoxin-C6-like protein [Leptotrombidium deliense]|uniref:Glutaredoxin-C6-like protein n=1 Tax=Leptotrombidium deliense TaxID=299467 RepID=A0A443S3B8_9ACAR|nr:glutaredoxin-C6-like protein [Leptotrombidium deliense]